MISASGHNSFQPIYLHPFPLPYYGLLMPLSSILAPLSSILIDFLSNFRSTLWPFSQLLSAYLINILSVVLLVCLPYFEVFPVLTFFSFHFITVQILRRFLCLQIIRLFPWLLIWTRNIQKVSRAWGDRLTVGDMGMFVMLLSLWYWCVIIYLLPIFHARFCHPYQELKYHILPEFRLLFCHANTGTNRETAELTEGPRNRLRNRKTN